MALTLRVSAGYSARAYFIQALAAMAARAGGAADIFACNTALAVCARHGEVTVHVNSCVFRGGGGGGGGGGGSGGGGDFGRVQ